VTRAGIPVHSWIAAAPTRAAYEAVPQLHARHPPEGVGEAVDLVGMDVSPGRHPAGERLAQGDGLLVDLLEHEVVVAALLGSLWRPFDERLGPSLLDPVQVGHDNPRGADVGDVALLEEDHPVGVREDRGDVTGDEALLAVETNDQRHVQTRPDQAADLTPVHHHQRVCPLHAPERGADRIGEIALVGVLDQVGDRLGVGLRRERVAAGFQLVPELAEVLDDPVVDHRDLPGAVLVRVGVEVVRPPVGCPAGMGEADRRMRGAIRDGRLEIDQLAGLLLHEQLAVFADQRDARGVVAAVFEPCQALDQDGSGLAGTGVADDAAHAAGVLLAGRPRPAAAGLV